VINPQLRIWLIQGNDLNNRPTGVTALDVQRPSRIRESQNQATWAVLVIRVVLDNLTSARYGLLNFHHRDVADDVLVNGMFRELELPTEDLDPNVLKHTHAKIILFRSRMVNLTMPNTRCSLSGPDQSTLMVSKNYHPKSSCFQALNRDFHRPKCPYMVPRTPPNSCITFSQKAHLRVVSRSDATRTFCS
jgi:hypothetical protein